MPTHPAPSSLPSSSLSLFLSLSISPALNEAYPVWRGTCMKISNHSIESCKDEREALMNE